MIDSNKWVDTLPLPKQEADQKQYELDPQIWTKTISKKKNKNSFKKFSFAIVFFVVGLFLVSALKNETRNLQKELEDLRAYIDNLKIDLHKAILDHEVITSPENISKLAKIHLQSDLTYYKKAQIVQLKKEKEVLTKFSETKSKNLTKKIKSKLSSEIAERKKDFKKIKNLYNTPEQIPSEVKTIVTKKIDKKRTTLKELYKNPKELINPKNIQQWGTIQLVKAFLGIPIIPGK